MRLFFAAFPPEQVVEALLLAQKGLRGQSWGISPNPGRYVRAERLHMTLRFLGERREDELPAARDRLKAAEAFAPIRVSSGGCELFGSTAVVRLDGGRALPRLVRALGERQPCKPHITLARDFSLLRIQGETRMLPEVEPFEWTVGEVALVESILGSQARYVVRDTVRLSG